MNTFTEILASFGGKIWMTVTFPIYTLYIVWRNKWKPLHSISDSYYLLKSKEQHEEILFTLFTYLLGIGTVLQYPHSFIFFLSGMGFFLVGTQVQFRDEYVTEKGLIHYIGAVIGIGGALIGLLLNGIWTPLLSFLILGFLLWGMRKEKGDFIFWVEILAFLTIITGLWIL